MFKLFFLLSLLIFISVFLVKNVFACGCGIAISEEKVFKSLKEAQAYLLINILDKNSYEEVPFFRFTSLDKSHDVKMVFPMSEIPTDVTGKKMKTADFLSLYGIDKAESAAKTQSITNIILKNSDSMFFLLNGYTVFKVFSSITGVGTYNMSAPGMKTIGTDSRISPVATFEFEGGKLDLYNVTTKNTLNDFVQTLNLPITGKVEELVQKYKNYFVAVLDLHVESVIPENEIASLQNCMPQGLEKVKKYLKDHASYQRRDVENLIQETSSSGSCNLDEINSLRKFIGALTYNSNSLEGISIKMKFSNTDKFFYPISVVNTYEYPVNDQKYYIKTPNDFQINSASSNISKIISEGSNRWYEIESTKDDLKGKIIDAGFFTKWGDNWRSFLSVLYEKLDSFRLFFALLIFILPLIILRSKENISIIGVLLSFVLFILGGLLLNSIVLFFRKKRILSISYLGIWIIMLILTILKSRIQI